MSCAFRIWKTIRIGVGFKTRSDFMGGLKRGGCNVGNWAEEVFRNPRFAASDIVADLELVNVSAAELGFRKPAKLEDIYKWARERGLQLCPAEVGPQLRLQYQDQPAGERLTIAMDPLDDLNGNPSIFFVTHRYGKLSLFCDYGYPDLPFSLEDRFVFVLPRNS